MTKPPEQARLSKSAEDYLEAIGLLCEKHGQAQVSDVAAFLGVKKPSVTAAIQQLNDLGLVEYSPYSPVRLSPTGVDYAQRVMRAHRVLRSFLKAAAGLDALRADKIACQLEHLLHEFEIDEIGRRFPSTD